MASQNKTLSLAEVSVGSIMTRQVRTIEGSRLLIECVRIMRDANIGSIVVLGSDDKPVGIFTERDLIRRMADRPESLELPMSQVMSKPLTTISPSATIWDAITLMGRSNIRRLPVVDKEKKLVGILTETDVFRLILSQQTLLLESISESIPVGTREKLKEMVDRLGMGKPPARV